MELRHLRYFVAVAKEQNVTRAATLLRVAQPSLSRQIRDLENMLGLTLFTRSAKSIQLTAAGKTFLYEANAILTRVDEALQVVTSLSTGQRKEIHVGYAPSLTVELLPRTLRLFQAANPDVQVKLHDLSSQEMLDGLQEGSLHVALMIQVSPKAMTNVNFEVLKKFAVCAAAHPSHPIAQSKEVNLERIAKERLIVYTEANYPEYHTWLKGLFEKAGLSPRIAEEHDGATSLIASVEAGRGVALVQQGFECLAGSRLSVMPLTPAVPPFVVGAAYRKTQTPPFVTPFVEAAKSLL